MKGKVIRKMNISPKQRMEHIYCISCKNTQETAILVIKKSILK